MSRIQCFINACLLLYRDDNEAVRELLASVNCVLRENIGTAAAGARASEEAVDVNCRRVLGVEVVAVHRALHQSLREVPRCEAEISVRVADHQSDAVGIRDAELANACAHSVILRLDIEFIHIVDRGPVCAECRVLSEIDHVFTGTVAEIFDVLEAHRHLEHKTEARQSRSGSLLGFRVEYRLDFYASCGVNSVFKIDLCNNALLRAEVEVNGEFRRVLGLGEVH